MNPAIAYLDGAQAVERRAWAVAGAGERRLQRIPEHLARLLQLVLVVVEQQGPRYPEYRREACTVWLVGPVVGVGRWGFGVQLLI